MANRDELFDEEPERPARQESPQVVSTTTQGFSRRRFLTGAVVAAAAGAVAGAGATVGVGALREGSGAGKGQPAAAVQEAEGITLGVPVDREIAQAVIRLNVNGKDYWLQVAAHETLAEVLRQRLGLTGTKVTCDRSECSACTVLVNGVPQNSCSLLAIREEGKTIVTIEGLAEGTELSPVQQAFMERMGLQCGFCTPGQIMQATALLRANPRPTEAEIRRAMSGNLCKCGAYPNIIAAVQAAAKSMGGA